MGRTYTPSGRRYGASPNPVTTARKTGFGVWPRSFLSSFFSRCKRIAAASPTFSGLSPISRAVGFRQLADAGRTEGDGGGPSKKSRWCAICASMMRGW